MPDDSPMHAQTTSFSEIIFIRNVADKPCNKSFASDGFFEKSNCISELYRAKILTEDDWLHYKRLFDTVHPGLINHLRNLFPGLAAGEERQIMFIKLNMNIKECAAMMGITVESVKKNRYRLKKKLCLSADDNLSDHVKAYDARVEDFYSNFRE